MKNKLPEEFKNKWVAALQSGEYKQTKGELGSVEEDYSCYSNGSYTINKLFEFIF